MIEPGLLLKRAAPFAIAIGIWLTPVPAGLTAPAWHLFAVFVAAIASVLLGAFPLLTAAMMAVGTVVLTGTITPVQAFSGFANSSVPAHGDRVHRRAGRGEVGTGSADQPFHGKPVRRLPHRPRLQHCTDRRGHRAGLSQQHGAGWCA